MKLALSNLMKIKRTIIKHLMFHYTVFGFIVRPSTHDF